MRIATAFALLISFASPALSQEPTVEAPRPAAEVLPDAPSEVSAANHAAFLVPEREDDDFASPQDASFSLYPEGLRQQGDSRPTTPRKTDLDSNGNPIPLERQQPQRILGFMPNFRSVSGGAKPPPPGWKYNFDLARRQAFDYSSFIFLGLTSLSAKGLDEHPALGKGIGGLYAYTWRGFLDKTDGTFLSGWLLNSLLHEDTRFYALGHGRSITRRALYVISRQGVARTYGGRQTPNVAGLGGKVLTQVISRYYYPSSASSFESLAEKFGYAMMRDVIFSSIREFYPDIAAHYVRKHHEKLLRGQQTQPSISRPLPPPD